MSYSFRTGFSVSRKVPGTEQVLRKWWPSDSVNEQMSSPSILLLTPSELLEGKNWLACPPGAWLSAFYGEDEDQLEKCV